MRKVGWKYIYLYTPTWSSTQSPWPSQNKMNNSTMYSALYSVIHSAYGWDVKYIDAKFSHRDTSREFLFFSPDHIKAHLKASGNHEKWQQMPPWPWLGTPPPEWGPEWQKCPVYSIPVIFACYQLGSLWEWEAQSTSKLTSISIGSASTDLAILLAPNEPMGTENKDKYNQMNVQNNNWFISAFKNITYHIRQKSTF